MNVDDLLDFDKMQPEVSSFWRWCTSNGIRTKPLILADRPPEDEWMGQRSPQATQLPHNQKLLQKARKRGNHSSSTPPTVRGVFTPYELEQGTLVAVVPFSKVISSQTLKQVGSMKHLLAPAVHAKAMHKLAKVPALDAEYLWLTGAVAALRSMSMLERIEKQQEQKENQSGKNEEEKSAETESKTSSIIDRAWGPYLDMLPQTYTSTDRYVQQVLLDVLPRMEQEAFRDAQEFGQRQISLFHQLSERVAKERKLSGALPSPHALNWAYRSVLSRALVLPQGCFPSAPAFSLSEFLVENDDLPILPAMVPVVDMFNSPVDSDTVQNPEDLTNCTVYTCEEQSGKSFMDISRGINSIMEKKKDREAEQVAQRSWDEQRQQEGDSNKIDETEKQQQKNLSSDSSPLSLPSAVGGNSSSRSIVVVTKRHVEAGEELTLGYGDGGSPGVGLYRYGFITSFPEAESNSVGSGNGNANGRSLFEL